MATEPGDRIDLTQHRADNADLDDFFKSLAQAVGRIRETVIESTERVVDQRLGKGVADGDGN